MTVSLARTTLVVLLMLAIPDMKIGSIGADESDKNRPATYRCRTPIEAMRKLEEAVNKGDYEAILALTCTETKLQHEVFRKYARTWSYSQQLSDALIANYSQEQLGGSIFRRVGLMFPMKWIVWENAEVVISGHKATIICTNRQQKLVKEDGGWKVFMANWDEDTLRRLDGRAQAWGTAMRKMTPALRSKKYATIQEAQEEFVKIATAAGWNQE